MPESSNPFTREFFLGSGGEAGGRTFRQGGEAGLSRDAADRLATAASAFDLVPRTLGISQQGGLEAARGRFRFGGGAAPAAAAGPAPAIAAPAAPIVAPEAVAASPTVFGSAPSPIASSLVGAINRSSGDTGSSVLNANSVERARLAGVDRANLVSSVDRSRQRSPASGILQPSQQANFNNVLSPAAVQPIIEGL